MTRLPEGLRPNFFLPNERPLHEALARLAQLSGGVAYTNAQNATSGSWAKLFDNDPLVAMAAFLSVNPDRLHAQFEDARQRPDAARALYGALLSKLTGWWQIFHRSGDDGLIAALNGAQVSLSQTIDPMLRITPMQFEPQESASARMLDVVAVSDDLDDLTAVFNRLIGLVTALRPDVMRAFEARLSCGAVDPALGLQVAQLHLLEQAHGRMNVFTDRHTSFFYETVLGLEPLAAVPRTVFLKVDPGVRMLDLPSGTGVAFTPDGAPGARMFTTQEAARLVPVEVAGIRRLRYHRKPRIIPQSSLGFVTSVAGVVDPAPDAPAAGFFMASEEGRDTKLGLRIEHPVLELSEGRREVAIKLRLAPLKQVNSAVFDKKGAVEARGDEYRAFLAGAAASVVMDRAIAIDFEFADLRGGIATVLEWAEAEPVQDAFVILRALLSHVTRATQVQTILGHIVAQVLIRPDYVWPPDDLRAGLVEVEGRFKPPGEASAIETVWPQQGDAGDPAARRELFHLLVHNALELRFSTDGGDLVAPTYLRIVRNGPQDGPGITVLAELDPALPAISGAQARSAFAELTLAHTARFCPQSLFETFRLEAIEIEVFCHGHHNVTAFSDDGLVNTSQPFMPFGARPKNGAAFMVGSPELAQKSITEISLSYTLTDLPELGASGDLEAYYHGYGRDFIAPDPKIDVDYLTADGWRSLDAAGLPLIKQSRQISINSREKSISRSVPDTALPPSSGTSAQAFLDRNAIRSGLIRLTLDCHGHGFGHEAFPLALASAMRGTVLPLQKRPQPNPPYTPKFSKIALDYRAKAHIQLNSQEQSRAKGRVVQLCPFGTREVFPKGARATATVFPRPLADGTLFIALTGADISGQLSLLFCVQGSKHERHSFTPQPVRWHYHGEAGWVELDPWMILSDSTDGMMRSGVVILDLPQGLSRSNPEMPGDFGWLAVSADRFLDAFPVLDRVLTNGVAAREDEGPPADAEDAPATGAWAFSPPVPGVTSVVQAAAGFGGRPAEKPLEFRARAAEGLRHHQTGTTSWDIERLVLQAFPQVWKTRCFRADHKRGGAGAVTVVVVPHPPKDAALSPAQPALFDILTLRRIEKMLAAKSSPFCQYQVRNPSFEHLQVRAQVAFIPTVNSGTLASRLKLAMSGVLSVWTGMDGMTDFGWSIDLDELGAFVQSRDYVQKLHDISVLHLVHEAGDVHQADGDGYRLFDTKRLDLDAKDPSNPQYIGARDPYSLPLPMADHAISVLRHTAELNAPAGGVRAAGIGALSLGETLVVEAASPQTSMQDVPNE